MSLKNSTAEPRVLGLSASLTYEVEPIKIETQIQQLYSDLCIRGIATATDTQLKEDGYATEIRVEVLLPSLERPVNYLPISDRRDHDRRGQFFERIISGTATTFASALVSVIRTLETECSSIHSSFQSPLMVSGTPLSDWDKYTLSLGIASDCAFLKELSIWYEALRLLVVSFEDAEDAGKSNIFLISAKKSNES